MVAGPTPVDESVALPDWVHGPRVVAVTSRLHLFEPQLGEVLRAAGALPISTSPAVLVARSASLGGMEHRLWVVLTDEPRENTDDPKRSVVVIGLDDCGRSQALEVVSWFHGRVAPAFLLDPIALAEMHRRRIVRAFEVAHPTRQWVAAPTTVARHARRDDGADSPTRMPSPRQARRRDA